MRPSSQKKNADAIGTTNWWFHLVVKMKTREVGSRGSITAFSSPLSRRENAVGENAADELVHAIPALLPLLIVPSFSAAPPCLLRQSHLIPPPVHTQRRRQDSRRPPHGALLLRFQQQGFTAGGPTASPRPPVRVRAGAGPRYGSAGAAAVPGQGPRHRPHRLRPVHRRRSQGQDGRAGREGGRAGRAVQEDGGRAARQRAGPAQLRAVPARGTAVTAPLVVGIWITSTNLPTQHPLML
jgi:hypothetical protein